MADLRAAMKEAGFGEVTTVAASGNVILEGQRPPEALETEIEAMLAERFDIRSCVMVRTADEVRTAISGNPFHGKGPDHGSDKLVHSVFLDASPDRERFEELLKDHRARGRERLAIGEKVLYLDYVDGIGVSYLTSRYLERSLGCRGTARNMNSLKNILSKME